MLLGIRRRTLKFIRPVYMILITKSLKFYCIVWLHWTIVLTKHSVSHGIKYLRISQLSVTGDRSAQIVTT